MTARGFAGPSKNFSPPGESSRFAMHCAAPGTGRSANSLMIVSGWPIPLRPQDRSGSLPAAKSRMAPHEARHQNLKSRSASAKCKAVAYGHDFFSGVVFGHYPGPRGGTGNIIVVNIKVHHKI
jgi:hypothetical protein